MALTVDADGTLSTVVGTATNLEPAVTPGSPQNIVYEIDCSALAAGETALLQLFIITLSGGTEHLADFGTFVGGEDDDLIVRFDPWPVDISIRCSVLQNNGSSRNLPWKRFHL